MSLFDHWLSEGVRTKDDRDGDGIPHEKTQRIAVRREGPGQYITADGHVRLTNAMAGTGAKGDWYLEPVTDEGSRLLVGADLGLDTYSTKTGALKALSAALKG